MTKIVFTFLVAFSLFASSALAGDLVIIHQQGGGGKKIMDSVIDGFKKENPDINVKISIPAVKQAYKNAMRGYLTSNKVPDVFFWNAGTILEAFVSRGLIEDISDLYQKNNWVMDFPTTIDSITFEGKQYAVVQNYYDWGLFYRDDIFAKYGLSYPRSWGDLLRVAQTLKDNGVTPFTIAGKEPWAIVGWFDILDLRINGLAFHKQVSRGKISWEDPRVKDVFRKWGELLKKGYFRKNTTSYGYEDSHALLFQGKAAMLYMGNWIEGEIPKEVNAKDGVKLTQFPVINADLPIYEDAPSDTAVIPSRAKNKKEARMFLEYIARPDVQRLRNDMANQISPNIRAGSDSTNKFLRAGANTLNSAAGTFTYWDQDVPPEINKASGKAMQEFLAKPHQMDEILFRLERERKRHYKIK